MADQVTDQGVRVVKAYGQFSVGRVIWPNGMERQRLLSSGFVEVVKAPDVTEAPKRPVLTTKK